MKIEIVAEKKELHSHNTSHENQGEKGRISGCVAMVLTVLWAVYLLWYFNEIGIGTIGGLLVNSIVMPHMICVTVAAIISCVGFFGRKRWAMLTSGILMAVSAVVMMQYLQMVIIQTILFFVSYARMNQ